MSITKKRKRRSCLIVPIHAANNFLKRGQAENISITTLKLQKLVYFLYRDYLKTTGKLLFSERFETWKKGPVVPSILAEFNSYGASPIKSFATDSRGKCYIIAEEGAFKDSIDRVWQKYKNYSGDQLSQLTHEEGSAWYKAKENKKQYLDIGDIKDEPEM